MTKPSISVVTLSFNQGAYIAECLSSLLAQINEIKEIIVVDPGSGDGSLEILQSICSDSIKILRQPDSGPAEGLNNGIRAASGDYLYILNADDFLAPGVLSEARDILSRHLDYDVLYANGIIVDAGGKFVRRTYSSAVFNAELYARGLAVIVQQSAFLRLSSVKSVGGFNQENHTSWDGELFFELARAGLRFKRVWRPWGRFRVYDSSITGSGRLNAQYALDQQRIRKLHLCVEDSKYYHFRNRLAWLYLQTLNLRRALEAVSDILTGRRTSL